MKELKVALDVYSEINKVYERGKARVEHEERADAIAKLHTLHHALCPIIDWSVICTESAPTLPLRNSERSNRALLKMREHKNKGAIFPYLHRRKWDRLKKRTLALRDQEELVHSKALLEYELKKIEWRERVTIANKLLSHNQSEQLEFLIKNVPFTNGNNSGEYILSTEFEFAENKLHVLVEVHPHHQIVPERKHYLLKSGRLSSKKMPVTESHDIYINYVASAVLKIGGDIFNLLPLEYFVVTCRSKLLNESNGHVELLPILSVRLTRSVYTNLNLEYVNPLNAMENFKNVKRFLKTKGLKPLKITNRVLPV